MRYQLYIPSLSSNCKNFHKIFDHLSEYCGGFGKNELAMSHLEEVKKVTHKEN